MPGYPEGPFGNLQSTPKSIDDYILEFDYEWRQGSRTHAVEVARSYIEARRAELEPILSKYTLEMLVNEIDELRKCGAEREKDRIIVDMWLLATYEPQKISGKIVATVKIPVALMGGSDGSFRNQW